MEEAVNNQIDENIKDQERFFKELGDIEELKSKNFFDNLSALDQLVGRVSEFQVAREKNREARELLQYSNKLYDDRKEDFLELQEKMLDMNDAQKQAALAEFAGDDPQALELLKMQFMPDVEQLDNIEFKQKYDDFAISGLNSILNKNNVYNLATRGEAVTSIDNSIEDVVTKYLMDADAKGLNINGREMRRYFNKRLFPALRKAKEKALDRWDRVSFNNLQVNRKREAQNFVIGTINSKDASGNYDGIYDDKEVGLIQLVQNKM